MWTPARPAARSLRRTSLSGCCPHPPQLSSSAFEAEDEVLNPRCLQMAPQTRPPPPEAKHPHHVGGCLPPPPPGSVASRLRRLLSGR
jgi:hypothetical protein